MAYQTTTRTSYGQRLGNSFKSVFTGLILFIGATVLLWWNEGRAVKTDKMLKQAEKQAVHVEDISSLIPELEGSLIHATSMALTEDVLSDPLGGVEEVAIKLERNVEFYQWVEKAKTEKKDKLGGAEETVATYTYSKKWTSEPVDSEDFADPAYRGLNTVKKDIEPEVYYAADVKFGAYMLPDMLISGIGGDVPVELPVKDTSAHRHVIENQVYYGADPEKPEIGDVRLTYTKVEPKEVSVMAKVKGNTFEKFTAKNGYSMALIRDGQVSMEEMFQQEHSANNTILWLLRILGLILVFMGLKSMVEILITILKVIPFIANIANLATGIIIGVISFAWSLLVIALAWIYYRPLLGILLLASGIGALVFFSKRGAAAEAASDTDSATT